MNDTSRDIDIAVFGATGFTGKLTALYLAEHAPANLRIAVAGRNEGKLRDVVQHCKEKSARPIETLIASVDDRATLRALAGRARVIATTVGPYAEYGEPLVEAAIDGGADCLDITGEPEFVSNMILRHHDRAAAKRVRIVDCCGFDSIPHDLGALYTVEQLDREKPIHVEGFVQAKGAISGGTWHSAVNAFAKIRHMRKLGEGLRVRSERVGKTKQRVRYEEAVRGWVAPMPTIDPDMVLRSASVIGYGPRFRYGHYVRVGSLATLTGMGLAIGGVVLLSQLEPTKNMLLKWKARGEGPSEEERAKNFFRVTFVGTDGTRRVVTRVTGGDPGYSETAAMLSETALALIVDRDRLPERYGVLTPAMAAGDVLIDRLNRAGISFETLSS